MRLVRLSIVFFCISIFSIARLSAAVQCSDTGNGRICSLQYNPETMKIVDDRLLIGTADELLSIQLNLQGEVKSVNLSSEEDFIQDCTGFGTDQLGNSPDACKNFIRVIQPLPHPKDNLVMICGTNAFHPRCTLHQKDQLTNYTRLSPGREMDEGYSPHSNMNSIVATMASNGRFFSATHFGFNDPFANLGMSPQTLQQDNTFTVFVRRANQIWLKKPKFVSAYEHGNYIYFFITESASEVDNGRSTIIYPRAIRICKSDNGISLDTTSTMFFRTFQKARMTCSYSGESQSIPYFYNDLKSTFLGQSVNGTQVLYGVFNSPANGPSGGAICKFSFDPLQAGSLTNVFKDSRYLVLETVENQMVWRERAGTPVSCPGNDRVSNDVDNLILKSNPVTSMRMSDTGVNQPLFRTSGEFLDKIAADTFNYNGEVQEVIYYTNQQGDIKQMIMTNPISGRESGTKYSHVIYQSNANEKVRDLILHTNNSERRIYASRNNRVMLITRGRCDIYTDCLSCFDSRDAYCGWSDGRCVNKFINSDPSTLTESFSANEAAITRACGQRPSAPPTSSPPSVCPPKVSTTSTTSSSTSQQIQQTATTTTTDKSGCTSPNSGCTSTPSGLGSEAKDSLPVPVIAGVTVGAFILGLSIGGIVCLLFYRRFAKSSVHPREEMYTKKPSEEQIDGPADVERNGPTTPVNNTITDKDKELNKKNGLPRYVNHKPPVLTYPIKPSDPNPLEGHKVLGSTTSLPMNKEHTSNKEMNHNRYHSPLDDDSAFESAQDTLPPLKTFSSTGSMYGSLGRNKTGSNGIARRQVPGKVPRGRTDSSTWLRQHSVSDSVISGDISPLQSPISDV